MGKNIIFQSSLPRAGSTLFQNLMAQNPSIYSTSTSGVSSLIEGSLKSFTHSIEFKNEKDYNLCKKNFYNYCRGGIDNYYSFTKKPIILDKSRNWLLMLPVLNKIYISPKVITLVRDLRSIFSSFEKQYLNNPEFKYIIQEEINSYNLTFLDRLNYYENLPALSDSLSSLQDIINLQNYQNNYIVKFEDLCTNPELSLKNIYSYLNLEYYNHDFNNILQVTYENDNFHILGDHNISPSLKLPNTEFNKILTPSMSNAIYEKYRWYFEYFNYPK